MDFLRCIILFVLKHEEKKKKINATSSNKNYINYCLKYFPQGINYKECYIFNRLYL